MEKYIKTAKNPSDQYNRCRNIGVSRSFNISSAAEIPPIPGAPAETALPGTPAFPRPAPPRSRFEAPYPACSTAAITASGAAAPSTPIELVNKLTEQEVTPSTLETAFSTRALHAAQLIPVTVYCSIFAQLLSSQCSLSYHSWSFTDF